MCDLRLPSDENVADYATLVDVWEANNAKIVTWFNNFVTHSIGTQLANCDIGKEVWEPLERLYTQSNFFKQYQLEIDIRMLWQNGMSIQEFYYDMSSLWDKLTLTESAELRVVVAYISRREEQRLVQFLMALHDDFEGLHGAILHHSSLPHVDLIL